MVNMNKKVENDEMDLDEFKQCLTIFKNILDEGDAELNFSPVGIRVTIKSDRLDDELASSPIKQEQFDAWQNEAYRLLRMILGDEESKFLKKFPENKREEIGKKREMIEKGIITKELIEKFLFQTTCKNSLLDDFDWEILKHQGKEGVNLFSTVQMQFILRFPSEELSRKNADIGSVSFECQKRDVEKLIDELMKIKEGFEK